MNLWIFQNSYKFFQFFITKFRNVQNERNVINFEYVFVTRFHITHMNFPGDGANILPAIVLILFLKNGIFISVKKIEKIHMDS